MATQVSSFIQDLNAGVFEKNLSAALSEVAGAVIDNGKTGKVTLTFDIKQISNSQQVEVSHKLAYTRPTMRGKKSEEDTTSTPMYVGARGAMTLMPQDQHDMFNNKNEA